MLFCRRVPIETEDPPEQYQVELASEERSAGVQRSLWEDDVMADTEGEDGFIVGACRLWGTGA